MEGLAASAIVIAGLLGFLLAVALYLYSLLHLAAAQRVRYLPKWAWAAFMMCTGPLGDAVYLLCQRKPRRSPEKSVLTVPFPRGAPW